jgi:TfoX/Sxy family transcriptional regulator of competence genes
VEECEVQIPRPSDADKQRFRSAVPADPRVEVKPMFGNLGAFVNGNMFAGLFGADIGVKLAAGDRELLAAAGGGGFGPVERPMAGYLTVPAGQSPAEWIGKALDHVAALPAKKPGKK